MDCSNCPQAVFHQYSIRRWQPQHQLNSLRSPFRLHKSDPLKCNWIRPLRTSITRTKGTADTPDTPVARPIVPLAHTFSFTLLVRMIFRSSWTTTASSDYIGAPRITTGAAARELAPSRPVSKFTGSTTYSESFPAHEATAPYVQPQSEAYASGMPFEGTTTTEADFQGLPRITTGGAAQEVRHTQRACLQFRLRSRTPLSSLSSLLCASSSHRRDQR